MSQKSSYIDRMEHFIKVGCMKLSLYELRLYLYLFHLNNRAIWREWFEVSNITLSALTGLSERNMIRAKNGLKDKGFIDFIPGRRGKPSKYRLSTPDELENLSNCTVKIDSITDSVTDSVTDREKVSQNRMNKGVAGPLRHKTKDIRHITPPKGGASDLFQTFYKSYPKHKGKQAAVRAFLKLRPDTDLFQRIMAALEAQKASNEWQEDGGRYIPYPAKWLNGRRWEDEMEVNPPSHENTIEQRDAERRAQAAAEEAYLKGADANGET